MKNFNLPKDFARCDGYIYPMSGAKPRLCKQREKCLRFLTSQNDDVDGYEHCNWVFIEREEESCPEFIAE